jgi:hypothetical protein
LALLLAASMRWLVTDAHPEDGSTLVSQTLGCAWAAVLLWIFGGRKGSASPWRSLLAGALFLGGPQMALLVRAPLVDASALTMALALTPVVIAVAVAAMSGRQDEELVGRLWPGLAAVAGLLLVLATPTLSNLRSDAVLVLAPLATGIGAALFCAGELRSAGMGEGGRWALTGAVTVFFAATAVEWAIAGRPEIVPLAVAWDGMLALLSVLTLKAVGETRWAAQFVLLPLIVLLEGIVLVRPEMTWRWAGGLALLAAASVYLLLPRPEPGDSGRRVTPQAG